MKQENQNTKMDNENSRQRQIADIKNSPLPKRGFKEFIEHDKTYLEALREEMEHKIVKLDILSRACQKADTDTREGTIKNITDKENHFEYVFLPQYEKELKESNTNFKDTLLKVRNICSDKTLNDLHTEVVNKMKMELEAYDGLDEKERSYDERQLNLYKPLKRLLGAFNKTQGEIEDLEKYK